MQQKIITELGNIREAEKKEEFTLEKLNDINKGIKKKEEELRQYERKMQQAQAEIRKLSEEIELLTGKLHGKKQNLDEHIKALYKQQYGGSTLILISAEDFQDLLKKSRYVSLVAYHDGQVISKYSSEIREINLKKKELEALNDDLKANKEYARKKELELKAERAKKDGMLASIRGKKMSSEKNIKELEESSQRLQDMIPGLKTKEIPQVIIGGGFISLKKNLPWPVDGKVLIPYGKYEDPVMNKPVFRNGIEIEAVDVESPQAVAGGRVIYADRFEGYGTLLIIDHGGGYNTLYGNLTETPLQTGDLLIKGMELGKISKSKLFNVHTLYFEIRHKGRPIDPMEWLNRKG
ncbi:MAG: peptidoglycan DD-metalloendopeptidase family protein [Nitrospirae bacterium]|nr:peptidoglycan DD-metalloendopeptidase family protein [Nitrospirota bacterium]